MNTTLHLTTATSAKTCQMVMRRIKIFSFFKVLYCKKNGKTLEIDTLENFEKIKENQDKDENPKVPICTPTN